MKLIGVANAKTRRKRILWSRPRPVSPTNLLMGSDSRYKAIPMMRPATAATIKDWPSVALTKLRRRAPVARAMMATAPMPAADWIMPTMPMTYPAMPTAARASGSRWPACTVSTKVTRKLRTCSSKGQTDRTATCRNSDRPARRPVSWRWAGSPASAPAPARKEISASALGTAAFMGKPRRWETSALEKTDAATSRERRQKQLFRRNNSLRCYLVALKLNSRRMAVAAEHSADPVFFRVEHAECYALTIVRHVGRVE